MSGPARRGIWAILAMLLVIVLLLMAGSFERESDPDRPLISRVAGPDLQPPNPSRQGDALERREISAHSHQTGNDLGPLKDAQSPWEEAAFSLAELEGKDVVRCDFGAELFGPLDGGGLLLMERVELRSGVLTGILSHSIPHEGRASGVVSIDGRTYELHVQRVAQSRMASCDVIPSPESSIDLWPQIERTTPEGVVVTEDWPFAAMAPRDIELELSSADQSAIRVLMSDPNISAEARAILAEWMAERTEALERAAGDPNTFMLR